MIWVGNFKSLQSALQKPRFAAPLQIAHLAPERDRPDLTVCGLAHESDRSIPLRSREGGVRGTRTSGSRQ